MEDQEDIELVTYPRGAPVDHPHYYSPPASAYAHMRLLHVEVWQGYWEPPSDEIELLEEIVVHGRLKVWGKGAGNG